MRSVCRAASTRPAVTFHHIEIDAGASTQGDQGWSSDPWRVPLGEESLLNQPRTNNAKFRLGGGAVRVLRGLSDDKVLTSNEVRKAVLRTTEKLPPSSLRLGHQVVREVEAVPRNVSLYAEAARGFEFTGSSAVPKANQQVRMIPKNFHGPAQERNFF